MTLTNSRNSFNIQGGWSNMAKGRVVREGREGRGRSKQGHVGSSENFSFYSGRGRKHLESFSREVTRRTSHLWRSRWLPCATSFPSEQGRWFRGSLSFFRAEHVPWWGPGYCQQQGNICRQYQEPFFWRDSQNTKVKNIDDRGHLLGQERSPVCATPAREGWSQVMAKGPEVALLRWPTSSHRDSTQEGQENDARETDKLVGLILELHCK